MPFLSVPSATDVGAVTQATTSSTTSSLGKDEFLRLFVTKLANQDPLSPMEDENFIAQMAQFTSLEQLTNISDLLEQSVGGNNLLAQSITNTLAPSLIGKTVRVETGDVILSELGDAAIRFDLSEASENVIVEITDGGGGLVRVLDLDGRPSGTTETIWDGKDANGERLPPGQYSVRINAVDTDGEPIEARSYFSGIVDGVRYANGTALLAVGDALVPMANVLEVFTPTESGDEN